MNFSQRQLRSILSKFLFFGDDVFKNVGILSPGERSRVALAKLAISGACPKHIMALDKNITNSKGYHPAHVTDEAACTGCGSCAIMCPDVAIIIEV